MDNNIDDNYINDYKNTMDQLENAKMASLNRLNNFTMAANQAMASLEGKTDANALKIMDVLIHVVLAANKITMEYMNNAKDRSTNPEEKREAVEALTNMVNEFCGKREEVLNNLMALYGKTQQLNNTQDMGGYSAARR